MRITTTLVAVAVVAIFLAIGAVLLVTETRARIEGTIAEAAVDRAESLSSLVVTTPESFAVGDSELVAQLVDSNGRVIASDASATGMPAFVDPGLPPGGRAKYLTRSNPAR